MDNSKAIKLILETINSLHGRTVDTVFLKTLDGRDKPVPEYTLMDHMIDQLEMLGVVEDDIDILDDYICNNDYEGGLKFIYNKYCL